MQPQVYPVLRRLRFSLAALLTAGLLSASAQETSSTVKAADATAKAAPTPAAKEDATAADDAVLVLSPFTVNAEKDHGYRATNSIGGTKMNTDIKDLPFTINAITTDFMRDIGAQTVMEALAYTPAFTVTSTNEMISLISVRGFPATVLRDGLTTYMQPNLAMVERIEVLEGASAIVYGQTAPGGVVNIVTKQANTNRRFGSFEQIVGQWGNYQSRFDYNEPLANNTLAFRISGTYTDQTSRRDNYRKTGSVIFPEMTWRVTPRTTVSVQFARDHSKTKGVFTGFTANYDNSTAGLNYLNQNYTSYYNSFTAAQRTLYGLPAPSKLMTAQVGGPAPIFLANPYTLNPSGSEGWNDQTRYDLIGKLQQVLVENSNGIVQRSDLQITAARIDDRSRGIMPTIDGAAPQGIRGYGVYSSDDFDTTASSPAAWTGALWNMGWDYSYWSTGNVNAAAKNQAGYYANASEKVMGAKNMAGSCYYYTPDLTLNGMGQYVPLAGKNTYEWSPVAFHLQLLNESLAVDDVTTFKFGRKTSLRLLVGAEAGRQRYWDYGRKGNLTAATGTSVEELAQNYVRGSSGWSSTTWGPASGNGHYSLPNWGYAFSDFGTSNPGTIWGAGNDRAYRGWYLWNAETGERRAAHITGSEILATADRYYYGLSQEVKYSAFYETAQLDLFDKRLSLLGAARYSDVQKRDYRVYGNVPDFPQRYHPLVPQAGLVVNLTRDFNLYSSYSENYYYQWSRQTNVLNEAPPIITGNTKEAGAKFQLFNGRISGSAALFENNFKNLTYTDYTFDLTAYNSSLYPALPQSDGTYRHQYGLSRYNGATQSRGYETNLQFRLTPDWDLIAQYSNLRSTFTEGSAWMKGLEAPGVPRHAYSLWNKFSFQRSGGWLKNFAAGAGVVYKSAAYVGSPYNNEGAIIASSYYWRTPLFVRYDAFAGYYFKAYDRAWAVTLNVKNLADRLNWTTDGNLTPDGQGREFILSVKVDF